MPYFEQEAHARSAQQRRGDHHTAPHVRSMGRQGRSQLHVRLPDQQGRERGPLRGYSEDVFSP